MGAVVVQQVRTGTKDIDRREVIDGQQRLTTLQLLLDAVQLVCEKRNAKKVSRRLDKLVTNDRLYLADNEDTLKLWPTLADRSAFIHAMDNSRSADEYRDSLIVQAHEYFQLEAGKWIDSNPDQIHDRIEALEFTVSANLQLVVIDLRADDDPHLIFETLNARGTPLLQSDLVKNYVLSKSEDKSNAIWGDLGDDWWREEIKQGRLRRPRIDVLLDYWLEMQSWEEVSARRVFESFKGLADGGDILAIMEPLKRDLKNFRRYEEGPRNPDEEIFHYRTGVMNMATFTPVLLEILSWTEKSRIRALKALESFLVRRMVCRLTTKHYNMLALDLLRHVYPHKGARGAQVMISYLSSQESDSRHWPTDKHIENALTNMPSYRLLTRGRVRLLLEAIEEYYRQSSMAGQQDAPKALTIEHILPQNWKKYWPLPPIGTEEEVLQNRNLVIHTIGNLTLVTKKLNASLSNAPWEEKRNTLNKHTTLFLNKRLIDDHKTVWDETTIKERCQHLARVIAKIWPRPVPGHD